MIRSVFFCVFVIIVNGGVVSNNDLFRLDIVHYNDFHARFQETSLSYSICQTNDSHCLGGFARLYHEISILKNEKPDALVLNAGDTFQGTYWYNLLKWNVTQEFINMLPNDAHTLGNHDFDDGAPGLVPFLKALKAPVVVANLDISEEPSMEGLTIPSLVVEKHGRKIGIIGLITTDTAILSSPGKVGFTDPVEAARREAEYLNEKGIDIIIILSHCGLDFDKELAKNYGHLIDIIVGGHTHSLLWNGPSPSGEEVKGSYPVIVQPTEDKQHNVVIVQASSFTKYMGNLSVYFDDLGNYVKWDGGPIFLNRSIGEDPAIKEKLIPYTKLVQEAVSIKIGRNDRSLDHEDCGFGECTLGDMILDALNDCAQNMSDSKYPYIAFMQHGNINHDIPKGDVTVGILYELLPYFDPIITFELQGVYVRQALEKSVSGALDTNPFHGPYVLQVSGIRVTYNVSQPEGSRIVKVTIGHSDSNALLEDDQYYQVTTPKYLSTGDADFEKIFSHKTNTKVIGRDWPIVKNYIENNSPLNVKEDGRIKVTN